MNPYQALLSKFSKYGALAVALIAVAQALESAGVIPAAALPYLDPALAYLSAHLAHNAPAKS